MKNLKIDEDSIQKIKEEPINPVNLENIKDLHKGRSLDKKGTPFENCDHEFKEAIEEIYDACNSKASEEDIEFFKHYNFNQDEVDILKFVERGKIFNLERFPDVNFIKTPDHKIMVAEAYKDRLEKGMINLSRKISSLESVVKAKNLQIKYYKLAFTTATLLDRIKLAFNIIFKGGLNG